MASCKRHASASCGYVSHCRPSPTANSALAEPGRWHLVGRLGDKTAVLGGIGRVRAQPDLVREQKDCNLGSFAGSGGCSFLGFNDASLALREQGAGIGPCGGSGTLRGSGMRRQPCVTRWEGAMAEKVDSPWSKRRVGERSHAPTAACGCDGVGFQPHGFRDRHPNQLCGRRQFGIGALLQRQGTAWNCSSPSFPPILIGSP